MQHEIAVNSRTHNVIQCMNYMERTRKKDKHKKWVVLRNAIENTIASDEIPCTRKRDKVAQY